MNAKYVLIPLICLFLAACNNRPEYVIDEDKMTDLLVDVHMSEGLLDLQGAQLGGERKNYGQEVMAAVLLEHGVTRAQYDTSLVWYSQNLKKLIRIYKNVDAELDRRITSWNVLASQQRSLILPIDGDNVDVWALDRAFLMDETRLSHSYSWQIPTDSCFLEGDTVRWKLHIYNQPKGQAFIASMALLSSNKVYNVDQYLDGVSTGAIDKDSTVVLTLAADKDVKISKMVLSMNQIHSSLPDSVTLAPTLIDSLELYRIHRK